MTVTPATPVTAMPVTVDERLLRAILRDLAAPQGVTPAPVVEPGTPSTAAHVTTLAAFTFKGADVDELVVGDDELEIVAPAKRRSPYNRVLYRGGRDLLGTDATWRALAAVHAEFAALAGAPEAAKPKAAKTAKPKTPKAKAAKARTPKPVVAVLPAPDAPADLAALVAALPADTQAALAALLLAV